MLNIYETLGLGLKPLKLQGGTAGSIKKSQFEICHQNKKKYLRLPDGNIY